MVLLLDHQHGKLLVVSTSTSSNDIFEPNQIPPSSTLRDRNRMFHRSYRMIFDLSPFTARKGYLPWQVQLIGPFLCSGTITATRIVITANHCVDNAMNPERWTVQAGHTEKVKLILIFNYISLVKFSDCT